MSECKCYYCVKTKEIQQAKRDRDVDVLAKLAFEIMNMAVCAEDDRDYYVCILDGSWPSAVEILENALAGAKNHKELQEQPHA